MDREKPPPPTFRVWKPSVKRRHRGGPRHEDSPRARGYDGRWDRLSIEFRKKNPFCRWCDQEDRVTAVDVVDHIIPRKDAPERMHDWKNLQSLCHHHHGVKTEMEEYARRRDELDKLHLWCADMKARPSRFRPLVAESLLFVKKPRSSL